MEEIKKELWQTGHIIIVGFLLAVVLMVSFPSVSQAYTYQSDEYRFKISGPEKPGKITVMTKKDEAGVALDFSQDNADYPVWMVMLEPAKNKNDNFIDPTTLTAEELREYFAGLQQEDYEGAVFEKADIIKVGKYNATLLITRKGEEISVMAMFKANRENYVITLLTDKNGFEKDFSVFQQYLGSFAELCG
ncbi:MAG TPA: hypothetical protein VN611_13705 [Patescibacteria group bacterium]|nr:hypothetical protein [Patescibacteria group bacterium]